MSGLGKSLFDLTIGALKWIFLFFTIVLLIIFLILVLNYFYMRIIKKDEYVSIMPRHPRFVFKNEKVLYNFFIGWPRQVLKNNANPDPNFAYPFGTWCYMGKKGGGKTMGLMRTTLEMVKQFPDVEIAGNVTIKDPELLKRYTYTDNIQDLFNVKNSKNHIIQDGDKEIEVIYPMLKLVDEVSLSIKSNRFGGKKNEEVDEELLAAIANQRKEKELYLYTVQRFHRGNKKLREQVDKIYKCFNIAGWMWCLPYILEDDADQENTVKLRRVRGAFNYVQTQELQDSYDTRQIVRDMVEGGLKSSDRDSEK